MIEKPCCCDLVKCSACSLTKSDAKADVVASHDMQLPLGPELGQSTLQDLE